MLSPEEVVEHIRRTEYGIGLPNDDPAGAVIANMRGKLDRALKLLSEELYAADTHFALELIQNAEDNAYPDGVEPGLTFTVADDALLVQNNEVGFAEENVRSLCNVAKSTKVKRLGYVGEKGIGFKSVFKITDEPYLCSNGYSFSLPRTEPETGLGYVIPVWRAERPAGVDPSVTNILLPLTPKGRLEAARLADISPSLLLFLRRLRRLELRDGGGNCTRWFGRRDLGGQVVIESDSGAERWAVVRETMAVPPAVREEKRQEVREVDLVLAFPVTPEGAADGLRLPPVYTFLPVRACGFRFAVQADFVLASSREDILPDRDWNKWLRDSIPALFMRAVERFKQDPGLSTTFLSYVPQPDDVSQKFFAAIPAAILDRLRASECVLTASGRWAKPAGVLSASPAWRQLIANEDLIAVAGKEFIDPAFHPGSPTLGVLGVRPFDLSVLVACLKHPGWVAGKGVEWLLRLFAHLSTVTIPKETAAVLTALEVIPLEGEAFTAAASGAVFLPVSKRTSYGFEGDLRVVRKALFAGADKATSEAARKFLRGTLGVRPADPVEIITQHILPVFEGSDRTSNWASKGDDFRVGAVEYIKDHLDEYEKGGGEVGRLRRSLLIKIVHPENRFYSNPGYIYLPRRYGNKNRLESLFNGVVEARFLDPIYLDRSLARRKGRKLSGRATAKLRKTLVEGWRQFFVRLGVETVLRLAAPPQETTADAIKCEDLEKLIRSQDRNRLEHALKLLDAAWDRYRPHLEVEQFYVNRGKRYPAGKTPTAFGKLVRGNKWIPTQGHGLRPPAEVFADTPEVRELLGEHVPYLGVELASDTLRADLGIRSQPSVSAVLDCLKTLATAGVSDGPRYARLYRYLDYHFGQFQEVITRAFREQPIIFVPGDPCRHCRPAEALWKDVSELFGDTRAYLGRHWKELKAFFVDKLGVPTSPSPQDYVDLLKALDKQPAPSEHAVWEAYRMLERSLAEAEEEGVPEPPWWEDFAGSGLYWTDKGEFWRNDDDLYVNDREELYELFRDRSGFAFFRLPPNQHPSFGRLIRAAGLPLLSAAVRVVAVSPRGPRPDPALTAVLRLAGPFLQRYLYFKATPAFHRLSQDGTLAGLPSLEVRLCDGLTVTMELHGQAVEVRRDAARSADAILVLADVPDPLDQIGFVLAEAFGDTEGMGTFIGLLLSKSSTAAMERLMTGLNIPEMPAGAALSPPPAVDLEPGVTAVPPPPAPAPAGGQGGLTDILPADRYAPADGQAPAAGGGADGGPATAPAAGGRDAGRPTPTGTAPAEPTDSAPSPTPGGCGDRSGDLTRPGRGGETAEDGDTPVAPRGGWGSGPATPGGQNGNFSGAGVGGGSAGWSSEQPSANAGLTSPDRASPDRPARNWFRVLARPEGADLSGEADHDGRPGDPPRSDEAARALVIEYERTRGRAATAAARLQPGYDVTSEDGERAVRRLIEVKGLEQRWVGEATVTLSGAQFDAGRRPAPPGCEYWLYVVDGLATDTPNVYPIRRPAALVDRVYLQAQDWAARADNEDRFRPVEEVTAATGLPFVEFAAIARSAPAAAYVTRYPHRDLTDVVPAGGYLRCTPLAAGSEKPARGTLVVLAARSPDGDDRVVAGEFRWSPRHSLEGELLHVDVTVRPKTSDPDAAPVTHRVPAGEWAAYLPLAVCEPLAVS